MQSHEINYETNQKFRTLIKTILSEYGGLTNKTIKILELIKKYLK